MNVQRNIFACAPPCQCGRFFLYAFIFVAWLYVTWILYSSESCIHACTLYPRTCLKTSRKTSGVYPWPWDSGVLHTWFPWWGTTVCSMQPCLWILYWYLTLRITDAFPCVGYTVASPCFGLHFFSVYCTWTALSLYPCFSCLCANAHMYVEAKEDFGCPPLLLSALFPWDRISHWNGRSPFFQLRMAISNPPLILLSPSTQCVVTGTPPPATPSVFSRLWESELWLSCLHNKYFYPGDPRTHT